MKPKSSKNFYSVACGRKIGIFTHWSTCEKSVVKFPNAVYKGFVTIGEAIHFLLAGRAFTSCTDIPVYTDDIVSKSVDECGHSTAECSCCCAQISKSTDICDISGHTSIDIEMRDCENNKENNEDETVKKEIVDQCNICNKDAVCDVIQCNNCHGWCHYVCTQLPGYVLYTLGKTKRKFTCEVCADVPADTLERLYPELREHRHITKNPIVNTFPKTSLGCQTDSESTVSTHSQTDSESTVSTHSQTHHSLSDNYCQVNTCICDIIIDSNSKTNEQSLETGIINIMDQLKLLREDLRVNHNQPQTPQPPPRQNSETPSRQSSETSPRQSSDKELKNAKKELEKVQNELRKTTSELENEKLLSKKLQAKSLESQVMLESDIRVQKLKTEGAERCIANLRRELDNSNSALQEQMKANQRSTDTINKLQCEIESLREEMLSIKRHSCREDSSLLFFSSLENPKRMSTPAKEMKSLAPDNSPVNGEIISTTKEKSSNTENSGDHEDRSVIFIQSQNKTEAKQNPPVKKSKTNGQNPMNNGNREAKSTLKEKTHPVKNLQKEKSHPPKKQVLLIGTSNIKYTSSKFMAPKNTYIKKVVKYSTRQAADYITGYNDPHTPDLIVYHTLCNDAESLSVEEVGDQMNNLVNITKNKFPGVKVLVSLGGPRGQKGLNDKLRYINSRLTNQFAEMTNVSLCDNSNLYYRSYPLRGVLNSDQKHLSRLGTSILARNIKEDMASILYN